MRRLSFGVVALVAMAGARPAAATEISCDLAESGFALVDGALSEWGEVAGITLEQPLPGGSSSGASDLSINVRCVYDPDGLMFAIQVRDDRIIRNPGGDPVKDDAVELAFGGPTGARRLVIFPGDGSGQKQVSRWMPGKKPAKNIEIAGGTTKTGYNLEIGLPWAEVPGWSRGVPRLPFGLTVTDGDARVDRAVQAVVTSARGRGDAELDSLNFQGGDEVYRDFLSKLKIRPADITLDKLADMDGDPGPERVIAAGKVIGSISDSFTYFSIPVASPKDVKEVRVVELTGDGRSSIIVRFIQRGNGGARELLSVWNLNGTEWQRTFAHEIGKFATPNKLTNTWTLRKHPKGKGHDLVFTVGEVVGFTQETWLETPADDLTPIILPWGEGPKMEAFRFNDFEFIGLEEPPPKVAKKKKGKKG